MRGRPPGSSEDPDLDRDSRGTGSPIRDLHKKETESERSQEEKRILTRTLSLPL